MKVWQYTVRLLITRKEWSIEDHAMWLAVKKRVELLLDFAFSKSHVRPPHIFVTIVDSQVIATDADGDTGGFAAYQPSMYHIVIAAEKPTEISDNDFFDHVLPLNFFHEFKHLLQDLDGSLANSRSCEDEAEEFAKEMTENWLDDLDASNLQSGSNS